MKVTKFINKEYNSNVYLIDLLSKQNICGIIDIGEFDSLISFISDFALKIDFLFLTHSHYDHIYHINSLIEKFPNCKIFLSEYSEESLRNPKLNLSYYHENSITFTGENVKFIYDNDSVELGFGYSIKCFLTPGHNAGSMCFQLNEYFFTGDSYIPGIPVVTKLKSGDKLQSEISLARIKSLILKDTIVCPGHGPIYIGNSLLN